MLCQFRIPENSARLFLLTALCLVTASESVRASSDDQIVTILRTHCVACHNNVDRQGGVSLLSAATIREGSDNGPLLDREDVSHSRLLGVLDPSADLSMPPDGELQLSPVQRQQLKRWVMQGAPLAASVTMPQVPLIPVQSSSEIAEEV